jgi:hypothetical protein
VYRAEVFTTASDIRGLTQHGPVYSPYAPRDLRRQPTFRSA